METPDPESIIFVPSRSGTLYIGTSYRVTCFVTVDRTAVDTDVRTDITVIPSISPRISSGDLLQLNHTTFSRNITFSVLTNFVHDRIVPTVLVSLSPVLASEFVLGSGRVIKTPARLVIECKLFPT